jgi:quinolinate synthase
LALAVADIRATASELVQTIERLRQERNAVILAHSYQLPEVQDIADFVGDSLACGVHFMAETAAILSPEKTVLLPDLEAGCSLADTITADQLRAWKAQHPGAVVVSYVNTSAEVKAESDYCCTSSNAEAVVRAIPEDKEILFCPDMFLGAHVERVTGRRMQVWMGECHVHAGIDPDALEATRRRHPGAELLVHPECGCTSATLYRLGQGDYEGSSCVVASTEGMVRRAVESPATTFIVATEVGILHRMNLLAPGKRFLPASEDAVCPYMKKITLEKVAACLERMEPRVSVPEPVASQARRALDRMVATAP